MLKILKKFQVFITNVRRVLVSLDPIIFIQGRCEY